MIVEDLAVDYVERGRRYRALDAISLTVRSGETLAIVGESGAGKSTLVRAVAGLQKATEGRVLINGQPVRTPRSGIASPVQIVFQHPVDALNRYASIGESVSEPLLSLPKAERKARVDALLAQVGLDPSRADDQPHAFSGGQLQRVVLARALAPAPAVLVCDEATSALDVSVQAQISNLLLELQTKLNFACLLVTHDLGLARVLADDIMVLRRGLCVEHAPAARFFDGPSGEYAQGLLTATRNHLVPPRNSVLQSRP